MSLSSGQLLQVLLCVNCKAFQSQIVKKTNKWECRVCSTKQTITQEFGRGTGAEVRILVQKLNTARGERESQIDQKAISDNVVEDCYKVPNPERLEKAPATAASKWDAFLDEDNENYLY